jgi:hypothetical protein
MHNGLGYSYRSFERLSGGVASEIAKYVRPASTLSGLLLSSFHKSTLSPALSVDQAVHLLSEFCIGLLDMEEHLIGFNL